MSKSYKETMNLPQTDFAMRANLVQNEPKRLAKWDEIDLYHKVLQKNEKGEPFVLHDGPPYANGAIHIGHAFNKILKDFVNKSHAQLGFYTPYIPGWDCHGQPIEHVVEVNLGPEKMASTDQPALRKLCREWAEKCIDLQRDGFKRLGVNADWQHPYLTFTPQYEVGNVEIFKKMYLEGAIYRGRKPIHWCKRCHTALAEAEIEYGDETSPSIFVNFLMDEMPAAFKEAGASGEVYVLIWTTTPWTLPANTAVSLAPDADYCLVRAASKQMIFAHEMVEQVAVASGWNNWEVFSACGEPVLVKGRDLAGLSYTCPVRQDLKGVFIFGDHVTLDTGTGAVHTAPGHGQDDYLVGQKFNIATLMPVDDNGILTSEAGPFAGLDVDEANPAIIEWLEKEGTLVARSDIVHSYPHCWRCHEPVIFRATDQWFVSMDDTDLRQKALDAIENQVTFVPAWASNRIGSMVHDRPDWCISRQRAWGVPIPVFKCANCGEVVANETTFDAVIDLFSREGSDAWFTRKPKDYLPDTCCCSHCGSGDLVPEKDILDVWWESGVSHTSVLKYRSDEGLHFPTEMYLEGSDQHRGWFQSALLTSVGAYGVAPYKYVIHCGFTVDEQGRKMSKSLGNGVDPADVVSRFGAEILRLWVASVDYSQDVSISDNILKQVSDAYRRIRNTFRFLLGNLYDFNPACDSIRNFDELEPVDRYMLVKTASLGSNTKAAYLDFKYNSVYRLVYDFVNELSSVYMDITKDRLYSEAFDSSRRRAVQTVLFAVLESLVRILAPILSFTCDEVWDHYPLSVRSNDGRASSAQLAGWLEAGAIVPPIPPRTEKLMDDFSLIMDLRELAMKALENAREQKILNKSQEACVRLVLPPSYAALCEAYPPEVFEELFIVSEVECVEGDVLEAQVVLASGDKCPRCWNYRTLGVNHNHPDLCERCAGVLDRS